MSINSRSAVRDLYIKRPHIVFVSGATGFIGTHLVPFLSSYGWNVRAGVRDKSAIEKLPKGVEPVVTGDLGIKKNWSKTLAGVQAVVHLAACVHLKNLTSQYGEEAFQKANLEVTRNLAEASALAGVKRFVFTSSIKVIGESTRSGEVWTEFAKYKPMDAYARSKVDAESSLINISRETGLEIVILRLPLVYGPGVKANFFRLIRLVELGLPLPIASIRNQRSFIYVGNLVDAIRLCLTHPKAAGKTFLISDGENLSTPDLVRRLAKNLGRPANFVPFPEKALRWIGKIMHMSATIDRLLNSLLIDSRNIRNILGWHPPFTIDEGLKETVNWYRRIKSLSEGPVV